MSRNPAELVDDRPSERPWRGAVYGSVDELLRSPMVSLRPVRGINQDVRIDQESHSFPSRLRRSAAHQVIELIAVGDVDSRRTHVEDGQGVFPLRLSLSASVPQAQAKD